MTTTDSAAPTLSDIWNAVIDPYAIYAFVAGNRRPCGEEQPVVVSADAVAEACRQWMTREPIAGRPWRDPLGFFKQLDERLADGTGRPRSEEEARVQIELIVATCEEVQRGYDQVREDFDHRGAVRAPEFTQMHIALLRAARVAFPKVTPPSFPVVSACDMREVRDAIFAAHDDATAKRSRASRSANRHKGTTELLRAALAAKLAVGGPDGGEFFECCSWSSTRWQQELAAREGSSPTDRAIRGTEVWKRLLRNRSRRIRYAIAAWASRSIDVDEALESGELLEAAHKEAQRSKRGDE